MSDVRCVHLQSREESRAEEDEEVDVEGEEEEDVNIEGEDEEEVDIEGEEEGGVDSEGGDFGSMPTEEQLPGMQRSKPDRYANIPVASEITMAAAQSQLHPVYLTQMLMRVCTCFLSQCKAAVLVVWQTQMMQAAFCNMPGRLDA